MWLYRFLSIIGYLLLIFLVIFWDLIYLSYRKWKDLISIYLEYLLVLNSFYKVGRLL